MTIHRFTDEACIQLLESCFLRPELLNRDASLLIMGDLNARVGTMDDFINDNHHVPLLNDYEEYLLTKGSNRDIHATNKLTNSD